MLWERWQSPEGGEIRALEATVTLVPKKVNVVPYRFALSPSPGRETHHCQLRMSTPEVQSKVKLRTQSLRCIQCEGFYTTAANAASERDALFLCGLYPTTASTLKGTVGRCVRALAYRLRVLGTFNYAVQTFSGR